MNSTQPQPDSSTPPQQDAAYSPLAGRTAPPGADVQAPPPDVNAPLAGRTGPPAPQAQPPAPSSKLAGILHAVAGVLGGNPTERFDPNTNTVVPNRLTTGQRVENVVGAGIRGAFAGAAAHGPGSIGQAFVAGVNQQQQRQQQMDAGLQTQAARAISAIDTARLGWQFAREKRIVHDQAVDKFGQIDNFVGQGEGNQDLGTYTSFADFLQAHPELKTAGHDTAALAAKGLIVNTVDVDDNGRATGVHVWRLTPDWANQNTQNEMVIRQYQADGNFKPVTISSGQKNGTVLAFLQANGYGALSAGQQSSGPKNHDEAVSWIANGSDAQQQQAQSFLNVEQKLSKGDALSKLETVPSLLARENAAAAIPQLQNMLQGETDPAKRVRITRLLSTAQAAHAGYVADQQSDANAKQLATQGSPTAAGRLLSNGSLTLADLKTRGLTPNFILQAVGVAQRLNPSYNPADETIAENIAKSPAANQFFGSANSLIAKGGTLDQLAVQGAKIPQNKFPVLNTVDDWQQVARGKGPLAGYAATILGVADDYGKVMGAGSASDSARNSALALIGAAQSPEARQSATEAIRGSVVSQMKERIGKNQFLQRQYGYALPQTPNAPNAPQQFSLGKWQQANPQGDVNAAKAAAQQKGLTVIP